MVVSDSEFVKQLRLKISNLFLNRPPIVDLTKSDAALSEVYDILNFCIDYFQRSDELKNGQTT